MNAKPLTTNRECDAHYMEKSSGGLIEDVGRSSRSNECGGPRASGGGGARAGGEMRVCSSLKLIVAREVLGWRRGGTFGSA